MKSMYGRHVKGKYLTVSASSENCETDLKARHMKSTAIKMMAYPEEDHVGHFCLVGSIQPKTFGKSCYIVTFILKSSRSGKFLRMKQYSELPRCLVEFTLWLECKTSITSKLVHSDQAKKYVSLKNYFRQKVVQYTSSAYFLESKRAAERYNRAVAQEHQPCYWALG